MAWFISDTHFNHDNIIKYCNRPFDNVKEMDKYMIQRWNSVVKEGDIIYHLGDFALGLSREEYEKLVGRLNGNITLICGNHDRKGRNFFIGVGFNGFYKKNLRLGKYILTHRPLAVEQIPEGHLNLHGHKHNYGNLRSDKYMNLCVEMLDYKPVWLDV